MSRRSAAAVLAHILTRIDALPKGPTRTELEDIVDHFNQSAWNRADPLIEEAYRLSEVRTRYEDKR